MRKPLLLLATAGAMALLFGPAAAQSVTYENTVKKIIAERCAACHIQGAPTLAEFDKDKEGWTKKFKGPSLADYKNVMILVKGSDAGALMRRLDDGKNTKDGKPGNMYNYLGKDADDRAERLEKIKKWVGNWTLKRRKDLSEAELAAITAPEK
ncbi:MAG TPA: cytochrome C [Burkholderiales bacterium]|nr:cytochrome C [Burkholderiales bacterium]